MITARTAMVPPLVAVALLVACGTESDELPLEPQFHSFASSEWSEPVHLGPVVNSPARELGAQLSPDGLSLYFGSDRPGGLGGIDIWVSRRACSECPWEAPVNLGPNVNSPEPDGSAAFSPDGHLLFFSSARAGGQGGDDIWVARRTDPNDDLGWGPAVNLGPDVNTADHEVGPACVPALGGGGANFYFVRGATLPQFDIYQAQLTRDGEVVGPAVPVTELNDPTLLDDRPAVRADGREVFFWSTRLGGIGRADIWVATRRSPNDPWSTPENLGAPVNTPFGDLTPGLSWDGRTLLFSAAAAARPSLGLQDIWMTTRTPSG